MNAIAQWILANPTEALALVSAGVSLVVAGLSKLPWLGVPEAKLRRWLTTVVVAVVTGVATEWMAPPFEWGNAAATVLALLGGATVVYRAIKWLREWLRKMLKHEEKPVE